MMRWMCELYPEIGFDCASDREIQEVVPLVSPHKIIYAQPCKKVEDIRLAAARGVELTVVDSVEEVEKLADAGWRGGVLTRLLVQDKGSKQPFSKKFGAPLAWLPRIYSAAKAHGLNFHGFSFHVGSECETPKQYNKAIADCAIAAKLAKKHGGFDTTLIDIGGGFVPNATMFEAVANEVKSARQTYFNDSAVRWIAEPGRFLAAPTHTLYTTVIGKKPVYPAPKSKTEPKFRITIDESVYGSFSNIPFDHQIPQFMRMRAPATAKKDQQRPTIIFGRTCDSGDCLGNIPLPDVEVGDVLCIPDMGAYTTVTASEFNGFPKAQRIYEAAAEFTASEVERSDQLK
jgi:ornithine decarboxylase